MTDAIIKTRDISFGPTSGSNIIYNTDSTICRNTKPTSAEVKCSLSSSLGNFKSLNKITLNNPSGLSKYNTQINLKIDHDYLVSGAKLSKGKDQLIHLEGDITWILSGNSIIEHELNSAKIKGPHKVESIIPTSSCFNLILKESISSITIPFTMHGKLREANSFNVINNDVELQGEISANVFSGEYSEVSPCT